MAATTKHQNFVGGQWVDGADGGAMDVLNPATGETIAEVPRGNAAERIAQRPIAERSTPAQPAGQVLQIA